jgi:hypothetical protein
MVIRLPASSTNTRRDESNSDAKSAVTPHRRSAVLVKYATQQFHRELGRTREPIHKKFLLNIQTPIVTRRNQVVVQRKDETLRSYIQRWSIIKNSAEDISDERAVDAFLAGLHHSDLVEELGRPKPKTVSKLMEVANRFADGEDAYNNKRGRSPEVDRARRQRQRYRNEDSHARQNQVAAGYESRDEEGHESRGFQGRGNRGVEKPKYSGPSVEDMLHGPCRIHYA